MAASVRQRLLYIARADGRPFNEVLQYFAMERFLYRLGESPHGRKFILKGALMLVAWKTPLSRATKDIDLLGRTRNNIADIASAIRSACSQAVAPDGLLFDGKSVNAERIAEDADYHGVRVRFRGALGTARVTMQIDVGFGDPIVPGPVEVNYPTLLDLPAPRLLGYSRESAIAEKFQTMVKLGILNSRLRDFFDIWLLSRQFEFDGQILTDAIRKTFAQRETEIPSNPVAFSKEFSEDQGKISQWRAFVRKNLLHASPKELREVVLDLSLFLGPVVSALVSGKSLQKRWISTGPWIDIG
ncbi:MAG: nucleotidyl transferase AbiEii/AbiGii toxin family protein [Deltaproteobacteria bacterium]|nr:nucleotidyl transferase AbiEii/AbiGii toxin family protein [Deltaproteobacteria bacterium]